MAEKTVPAWVVLFNDGDGWKPHHFLFISRRAAGDFAAILRDFSYGVGYAYQRDTTVVRVEVPVPQKGRRKG